MKIYKYIIIAILSISLIGCEEETEVLEFQSNIPSSFSFSKKSDEFGASSSANQTYQLEVQTTEPYDSDVVFNLSLTADEGLADPDDTNYNQSPSEYSFPATMILPAGKLTATADVVFNYDNISYSPKHLVLDLGVPEGLTKNEARETIDIEYSKVCTNDFAIMSISFDNWAEESSWEILDNSNNIVASNAYGTADRDTSVDENICLIDGSYTLYFYDAYGDGMSYGTFSLSYDGNIKATGGGNLDNCPQAANVTCQAAVMFSIP